MKVHTWMKVLFCLTLLFVHEKSLIAHDDLIIINKQDVEYKFVKFDEQTDHFAQNIFWNWENETFEVFNQVKNKEAIAIDLGAWIGTTAIWLSKNFDTVVAVEPDVKSLECMRRNLEASECTNVLICERPVSNSNKNIIFGPRGSALNESISYVKNEINNVNDYEAPSISFKKLIYD